MRKQRVVAVIKSQEEDDRRSRVLKIGGGSDMYVCRLALLRVPRVGEQHRVYGVRLWWVWACAWDWEVCLWIMWMRCAERRMHSAAQRAGVSAQGSKVSGLAGQGRVSSSGGGRGGVGGGFFSRRGGGGVFGELGTVSTLGWWSLLGWYWMWVI